MFCKNDIYDRNQHNRFYIKMNYFKIFQSRNCIFHQYYFSKIYFRNLFETIQNFSTNNKYCKPKIQSNKLS